MKKYLAIYLGSAVSLAEWKMGDEKLRKEQHEAGMHGWMKWSTYNKTSIVDHGSPLGKTKHVNAEGISDTKNNIGAYTIVVAESHEEAAKLFVNHPHFMIFPGDSIEVMECLPTPEMSL